ncbi:ATPase-activating ribosome biosynthesis protein [Pycnococcus provasolii]|uniref:ATPase-activating ribosome biosynthesis protein n=1 Tax=Pycnococcus provasolii TaxID=41880 RepID=A0A830HC63_9CHLO|nr:ATPase-activating ribosome biosynthesis protein [Pycnococcus provasolii]|mmetsp:Transcript_2783/g.6221  ORF Transcript_2783/g.6221 Transcript_2783/m.6221 type:complete len:175 (-) Transcript_2783:91-615(-)
MRLEKCYFCSSTCYPGHGITFVRNDSKVFKFCRSKCHANFKMKRNPRKVKWTKAYRRTHGKDLAEDTTFEFERRRNRPERYNRDVLKATVKSMKRIGEIRQRREERHWEARMASARTDKIRQARRELVEDAHLLKAPARLRANATEEELARENARLRVDDELDNAAPELMDDDE